MENEPLYEKLVYIPIGWREDLIERVEIEKTENGIPVLLNEERTIGNTIYRYCSGRLHSDLFVDSESGERFRLPGIETDDGHLEYYLYGALHRREGPAVIAGGGKIKQYWVDGEFIREDVAP